MISGIPSELNISTLDNDRKPKFSSNAHLTSIDELYQYCPLSDSV